MNFIRSQNNPNGDHFVLWWKRDYTYEIENRTTGRKIELFCGIEEAQAVFDEVMSPEVWDSYPLRSTIPHRDWVV